jgi:FdhD protein
MIVPQKAIHYERYEFKTWKSYAAETIVESPVSLTVNGEVWLTFMCTQSIWKRCDWLPYNEGSSNPWMKWRMRVSEHGDNVDVWLNHSVNSPNSATDIGVYGRRHSCGRAGTPGHLV